MNLETRLDPRLWDAIRDSYTGRDYTGAILDAALFLSDLIREKTGLQSDGVALVGQALGGKSPKLKTTRLQTESDWNVQNGLEQLLRGFYQAIRNPRSHEKHTDSSEDADAIILFINYVVRVIGRSKTPFVMEEFLGRVFDPDFVRTERYAELLVEEIPPRQRYDVFVEAYRMKENGDARALQHFFKVLLKSLPEQETAEACTVFSDELKVIDNGDTITAAIQVLPPECWPHYSEVARLRVENILHQSVGKGRYEANGKRLLDGHLGLLIQNICKCLGNAGDVVRTLVFKLEYGDRLEKDYVLEHFVPWLDAWFAEPPPPLVAALKKGLEQGDPRFAKAVGTLLSFTSDRWTDALRVSLDSFSSRGGSIVKIDDDDLPF